MMKTKIDITKALMDLRTQSVIERHQNSETELGNDSVPTFIQQLQEEATREWLEENQIDLQDYPSGAQSEDNVVHVKFSPEEIGERVGFSEERAAAAGNKSNNTWYSKRRYTLNSTAQYGAMELSIEKRLDGITQATFSPTDFFADSVLQKYADAQVVATLCYGETLMAEFSGVVNSDGDILEAQGDIFETVFPDSAQTGLDVYFKRL